MKPRYIKRTKKQIKADKNLILRLKMYTIKCWNRDLEVDLLVGNTIWDCMFNPYSPNFIGYANQKREINKIKMALELRR